MPKNKKTESETPKLQLYEELLLSENSVLKKRYRKRRPYARRNLLSLGDEVPSYLERLNPLPVREFEPQPSTSSAPDPVLLPNVTPENFRRYQGAPPGTCKELQYSRTPDGGWIFHKDYLKAVKNAYKDSPDWRDLKAKRFNTSFLHETRRGNRDIQIFTEEEENDPKWKFPVIGDPDLGLGVEPGKKYEKAFLEWAKQIPDDKWDKKLIQMRKKVKRPRGRPKQTKVGPYSDEALDNLTNWDRYPPGFFDWSGSEESEEDVQEKPKQSKRKGAMAKKGKPKVKKGEDSDSEYEEPKKDKKSRQKRAKCGTPKKCLRMDKTGERNGINEANGEHCSMELNEGGKVSGKETQERRKSLRNAEKKKYAETDSDYKSDDNVPVQH